jgi:hypothetical protein
MVPNGMSPDAALTGALLKAAARCGRSALAKQLADHACSIRCPGNSVGGSLDLQRKATMIKAYARDRDLKGAMAVFERLQ